MKKLLIILLIMASLPSYASDKKVIDLTSGGLAQSGDIFYAVRNGVDNKVTFPALSQSATIDTTNASNITTGTLSTAVLPSIPPTSISGLRPIAVNVSGGTTGLTVSGGSMVLFGNQADFPGLNLIPTGSLKLGLTDAFLFGGSSSSSTENFASGISSAAVSASMVGSPTFNVNYATLSGSNYTQTSVQETSNYTIIVAMRMKTLSTNGGTYADTYALDPAVNNGATKFGAHGVIKQTSTGSLAGTIDMRIGYAKPSTTSPLITYTNPTLSVSDVSQWRLIAVVVQAPASLSDGGGAQILDLTNGVASTVVTAGAGYYRFPNTSNPFRIGQDYANFATAAVDVAAWVYYNRALSSTELTTYRNSIQPFFAARGIQL